MPPPPPHQRSSSRSREDDRSTTTERLRSLVQELQTSNPSMASKVNQTIHTSDNRSVDEESLSLSSGLESRHLRNPRRPMIPPPPPRSVNSERSRNSNNGYAIPHMGSTGGRMPSDPSVASSRRSQTSSRYTRGSSRSDGSDVGQDDPVGYVMPMGMGMLPDGTVYTQNTSSVYGSSAAASQRRGEEESYVSGASSGPGTFVSGYSGPSGGGSVASSVANSTIVSHSSQPMSGMRSVGMGPSSAASAPGGSFESSHRSSRSDYSGSGSGGENVSVMSRSYMSQPNPVIGGSQGSFQNNMQMAPFQYDASTFGSRNSRSIAGSAALIPKAKFSWATESLGTQSTVMTRRSMASSSANVPEPMQERKSKVVEGRMWASFAWFLTFPIPNKCIMRPTKDAKQAWREKVALFLIMVSCSVFFVGVFGFVPLLLCNEEVVFGIQDIWAQTGENWVIVHGVIYDVKDLIYKHPGGVDGIVDFLGKDASKVFPRAPPATLPEKCLDMQKVEAFQLNVYNPENNFTNPTCASFTELDQLLGITCHTFAAGSNGTQKFLGPYERGILKHTTYALQELGVSYITIYDRVYDVTTYVRDIRENQEPAPAGEEPSLDNNPSAWLTPTLNKVIMNSLNTDATDLYEALFGSTEYIACLEELFYTGLLDDNPNTFCATLNIMMYVMLILVALLMVIQFLASMIYICPRNRTYTEEDVMSPVMIMVPCYNEGDNELRKTIKSVLNTSYPDENKVLFMVADGLVTGNGEDMSTPEHLANILGFDIDDFEDDTFEYDCIGVVHTKNRARVYHGILQKGHKFLKYIAVVKCGLPEEATTSAKPGNRGKRDSQLITIGYFNRIHYGRELTELDSAVQRAMVDLNLQADMVRFLMAIDADTRVDTMSITHMVYGMDKKEKVLALCGETKVDNKASSWVTMIQVFEYYNSHHLKKAFEAAFGCVTCLPGCFTMYRIIADDGTPLLPGDGVLWEYSRNDVETLHEKNLYHLGEDRMLTTLLLKYYPDRSLTFIPEATCWTIVPHTFKILLSQRRRWINSTVHNMFELLKVNTMCGVCCASMKVVVFIDLIATMILPASYCYAMYLLFLVFFEDLPVSTVLLILYAIIMGVQVVVFILRSRWEYIWWFFIYFTIGLPVFYLILPTYSFWNMDDFSWGKTRSVGGSAANNAAGGGDEEDDEDDEEARSLMDKDRDTRGYSDDEDEDDNDMHLTKNYDEEDERSTESSSEEEESGDEESSEEESDDGSESENEYSTSQYSSSRRSAYSGSRSNRR